MSGLLAFLREAKAELIKVNWPTRDEVIRLTVLVVLVSVATAMFLGLLDLGFSRLAEKFLFGNQ